VPYGAQGRIRLSYQNSRTKRWNEDPLTRAIFLGRFLTHFLPKSFMHIRHYGWLAGAARKIRPIMRALL
jgi:hypothetical protein